MSVPDETPVVNDQTPLEARPTRDSRLSFRASARQATLFRRAAEALDKSMTEFVLDSASAAAEQVLADRRWFQIDQHAWTRFEVALERPAVFKPRLSESLHAEDPFVD